MASRPERVAAYESDLRDKRHGRVYRVVPTEGAAEKLHEFASLADMSNEQLVLQLKHPSFMWRLQAQRLLVERRADNVLQELLALVSDESVDEIGLSVGAIHGVAHHGRPGIRQAGSAIQIGRFCHDRARNGAHACIRRSSSQCDRRIATRRSRIGLCCSNIASCSVTAMRK